jgi:hypothetical protein
MAKLPIVHVSQHVQPTQICTSPSEALLPSQSLKMRLSLNLTSLVNSIFWPGFHLRLGILTVFLWFGIRHFRKMEKSFSDLI